MGVIKKLNDMDRVLPEVRVYQIIVLMLLVVNLVGLGMLLYNQYNDQFIPAPPTLIQTGGAADYQMCLDYYTNKCEPFKGSDDQDKEVVDDENMEDGTQEESMKSYTDTVRGIGFYLVADEALGVLADPQVSENTETGSTMFTFEGTSCELSATLMYAEYEGTLSEWLEINYPDQTAEMLDYQVLGEDAYMLVDEDTMTHYFFIVDGQIGDLYAMPAGDACVEGEDDLTPTLEAMLKGFEYTMTEEVPDTMVDETMDQ
ncbi:hypothetical protein H6763_02070 [Candidatus Nomurabacteria bacterium]|nr:hypothetical protein [Candidatus Nomurabacteria bacterium]